MGITRYSFWFINTVLKQDEVLLDRLENQLDRERGERWFDNTYGFPYGIMKKQKGLYRL